MKRFHYVFIFFASGLVSAIGVPYAHAAMLTATAPSITIDTEGQSVNAIEIHLSFDPQVFTIAAISDGGSVVDNWIAPPAFSNASGTVDLTGIIPGGITTASGTIVSFTIIPRTPGMPGQFTVKSAQVLLNDGEGTKAGLSVKTPQFSLAAAASAAPLAPSSTDTLAPDPFTPQIANDPSLFGGAYFLVFGTTDQGSGIDHYEVLEAAPGDDPLTATGWQAAQSPYVLQDQSLESDIYVRAFDHAGNFRIAEVPAATAHKAINTSRASTIFWGALGILIISIALFLWTQRRKHA